jgi:hypothetical protein
MQADASTRSRAAEVDKLRLTIQNISQELRRIEMQLKSELERAAAADALVRRIQMFKGAIDVSLHAKEAAALFNDTGLSDIRDPDTLVSRVKEVQGTRGDLTITARKQFDVKLNERNELIIELLQKLKASGFSDEEIGKLRANGL